MNRKKQDKSATCSNCGHQFESGNDNFCPICGQDNRNYIAPFRYLIGDFFANALHLESKLWVTLKDLVIRPGEVTNNFIKNRRARYVPPVRLYLAISFLFFILVSLTRETTGELDENIKSGIQSDSTIQNADVNVIFSKLTMKDLQELSAKPRLSDEIVEEFLDERDISSDWLTRKAIKALAAFLSGDLSSDQIVEKLLRNISTAMFFLMPIFALILMLVEVRKKLFYAAHLIFSLHFHTFAFLLLLLGYIWYKILPDTEINGWLSLAFFVYLVFSLKKVYNDTWGKAIFKSFFLYATYSIVIFITMGIALILSVIY